MSLKVSQNELKSISDLRKLGRDFSTKKLEGGRNIMSLKVSHNELRSQKIGCSRGQQKEAEGSRRQWRAVEGSRGQQRRTEGSRG